jgi:sarcosine oxidase / L-pipecolate oxidase
MSSTKHDPVIIIGSGAWGLSTALHLHQAGYTDITVFDRADTIPSPFSAAYDLNKIVRAEYEDPFYTELALVGALFRRLFNLRRLRWVLDKRC